MAIYVALVKMTTEGKKNMKDSPERTKKTHEALSSVGAKIIGEYAFKGPYDAVRIIEGPDDIKKMFKALTEIESMGATDWQIFSALPIEEYPR